MKAQSDFQSPGKVKEFYIFTSLFFPELPLDLFMPKGVFPFLKMNSLMPS